MAFVVASKGQLTARDRPSPGVTAQLSCGWLAASEVRVPASRCLPAFLWPCCGPAVGMPVEGRKPVGIAPALGKVPL